MAAGAAAELPPGRGELEFRYTGLELGNPQGVRFRYHLAGFDADWIEAGARRTAYYTNIPPGEYRFEVQASNGEDLWSSAPGEFRFRLAPHFYQTAWFYVLCGLALLAGAWEIYQLRVRQLKERERELASRIEEAMASIRTLRGLLPICSACKKIRDDRGYWEHIENYIRSHSDAQFTHGICPECMKRLYGEHAPSEP